MQRISLKNTSRFPTEAVRIVAQWAAIRAGIDGTWSHMIVVQDSRSWSGYGGSRGCTVRCGRRIKMKFPYVHKYRGIRHAPQQTHYSAFDILVGLLCHECYHATGGLPAKFTVNGRYNHQRCEFYTETFENEALADFRKEWPEIRTRIKLALRAAKARRLGRQERKAADNG